MARTVLDAARKAYARKSWQEVIRLLEPMVVHHRDSFSFYRLLGLACLRSGDQAGAATYLRRALQLSPGDQEMELGLAAIEFRRRDSAAAVEAYLEILERHPRCRLAKKALDFLRTRGDEESLNRLVDSGRIADFYPGKPRPRIGLPILSALAVGALAVGLTFSLRAVLAKDEPRKDVEAIQLSGREVDQPLQAAGSSLYIITEKEALENFERCKRLFQSYRDNAAIIEANRLLNSNASEYIKEKARQLKALAQAPTFQNLRDVPSFAQVMESPALYEGAAVIWKGRLANVKTADSLTRFDFLVGYQDRKKVDGIVPVTLDADIKLDNDRPVELLASVQAATASFQLEGIAVHDLSYASQP